MTPTTRIDLAREAEFQLGAITVLPSTREVIAADGAREIVEPRVMQVLVALCRAGGAIVSRDDLSQSCWEGRVVGDDAINRVISRLRRLTEGAGRDSFRVETVTKVGYRLIRLGGEIAAVDTAAAAVVAAAPAVAAGGAFPHSVSRRWLIAGGGAIAGAAAATAGIVLWRQTMPPSAKLPAPAAALTAEAFVLLGQDTPDGTAQAIGLLRRVVELAPGVADAWGALAMAYANATLFSDPQSDAGLMQRAASAVAHATTLDPDNAFARSAQATLLPRRGNWLRLDRAYRAALRDHGDNVFLVSGLASLLSDVGRDREAARQLDRLTIGENASPALRYRYVLELWSADRLEEADAAIERAYQLFPTHAGVWFTRFYLLLYTGRPDAALALAGRVNDRPIGIPEDDFRLGMLVATALVSRDAADADRAVSASVAAAHDGSGYAINAISAAGALGRVAEAFAVAEALYANRGFVIPQREFSSQQRLFAPFASRQTRVLFQPQTQAMRRDPRFGALVDAIGLTRFWAQSGVLPDYQRLK